MKYDFLKRRNFFEWNENTPLIIGAILVIVMMFIIIFSNSSKKVMTDFNSGKTFKCYEKNYYIEVNKSNSKIDKKYIYYTDGYKHYLFPLCKCVIKN